MRFIVGVEKTVTFQGTVEVDAIDGNEASEKASKIAISGEPIEWSATDADVKIDSVEAV